MKSLLQWFEHRTGARQIQDYLLKEKIPGGARWRYIWGSTLMFTFAVQVITGVFLWMAYSPSVQTAWPSVFYIQNVLHAGWLLRGIHHFTAQVMILLLGIHLLQVVWDGAYRPPREINFWFGLILLQLVLALSLTGYLLPWDQKGYWATKVATNIFGTAPVLGPYLQKLLMGGSQYGHLTLTHFLALHAGVLPGLLILLLTGHIYLFRRHGLTVKQPLRKPDAQFWPDQFLKDSIACFIVLITIFILIFRHAIVHTQGPWGAELGAPANPTEPFSAARPEWYFLFMFQFLKLFPGGTEVWGAIIIPNLILGLLFLFPFIARLRWGHRFNLALLGSLITGISLLTFLALYQDLYDVNYQAAVREAAHQAERAVLLAESPRGIPVAGGLALLSEDPLTEGPKIFARNCASCHRYGGEDGLGRVPAERPKASDLKGFASREWLTGFLDPQQISSLRYFGGTRFKIGKMARFVHAKIAPYSAPEKTNLTRVIMALSAEAHLKSQQVIDHRDTAAIQDGAALLKNQMSCTDCHRFHNDDPDATAPNLTGYGSREWLIGMITNPSHNQYYGQSNDHMPAFGSENILTLQAIGLVADWLRGDWYVPLKLTSQPSYSSERSNAMTSFRRPSIY